jgi:hypothetical protein
MDNKQLSLFDGATLDPEVKVPESALKIAQARERLIKIRKYWIGKVEDGPLCSLRQFLEDYNRGSVPELKEILGHISRATFYNWLRDYREGGFDALIPRYATGIPGVSLAEKRCLMEIVRDGISIGRAIFICKYFLKRRGTPSPSSPATLRRWAKKALGKRH